MPPGSPRQENKMQYLVIGDIMGKCRGLRDLQREGLLKKEISYSVGSSLVGRKACQQVYSVVRRTMVARVGDRQLWKL